MLRGSVVIFTGILSTLFLGIRHPRYRWFALGAVFMGVLLVGLAGIVEAGATSSVPVQGSPLGLGMVVLAQVFTAFQFVIEVGACQITSQSIQKIHTLFIIGTTHG